MACRGPSDGKVASAAAWPLRGLRIRAAASSRRAAATGPLRRCPQLVGPHTGRRGRGGAQGRNADLELVRQAGVGQVRWRKCRTRLEPSRLGSRGRGYPSPEQLQSLRLTAAAWARAPARCLCSPPTTSSKMWVSAGPGPQAVVCCARKWAVATPGTGKPSKGGGGCGVAAAWQPGFFWGQPRRVPSCRGSVPSPPEVGDPERGPFPSPGTGIGRSLGFSGDQTNWAIAELMTQNFQLPVELVESCVPPSPLPRPAVKSDAADPVV